MSQNLGNLTIIANTNTRFLAPTTGIKGLIIVNESGLSMTVTLEGTRASKPLGPSSSDYFPVSSGFTGSVLIINPTTSIGTALLYPGSFLTFYAVGATEEINSQAYPVTLNRPMSAGTQSGAGGFSCALALTVSASPTNRYGLSIWNNTATTVARIYSIQTLTSDLPASTPKAVTCNLSQKLSGAQNVFTTPVAVKILNHNISAVGTTMTLQAFNDSAIPAGNTFFGTWLLASTQAYEFLGPPDTIYLNPGQQLNIDCQNPIALSELYFMMKWTEA